MPDDEFQQDGWDWTEADEFGERSIPRVTELHTLENSLNPTPPIGWLKVISYDSAPPVSTIEAASWLLSVACVQNWERNHGRIRQAHLVSRDLYDRRVLVVHPDLRQEAVDTVETLNGILSHCNCGGFDCIEPHFQHRAALLFARRSCEAIDPSRLPEILEQSELSPDLLRWADLTIPQRARMIHDERLDPGAIGEDRHWLDVIKSDSGLLHSLAREMYETAVYSNATFFEHHAIET